MPFDPQRQVFNSRVSTLEVGTGPTTLRMGGENIWPLYTFDGELENPPRVGVEVSDLGVGSYSESIQSYYTGCNGVPAIAEKAAAIPGVEFVSLVFEGADPGGENRSVEECVALAKAVAEQCPLPLCIQGCGNVEKDAVLFEQLAEGLLEHNVLFLSAKEDNYKAVGAAVALAWGQKLAAESAVDINLAKQLNLLLSQLGVQGSSLAMDVGSAAAGYGFEYVASTMERVKITALAQDDASLQMPIITPIGLEAWGTKEALADEADFPAWGSREERGISMEVVTAAACLAAGSNAVILRHPEAVSTIAAFIDLLVEGGDCDGA